MEKNPYDHSGEHDFDLPPVGLDPEEEREELLGKDAREEAQKQKATASILTESRAFAILAEYVEQQKIARTNHLLLTTITNENKDSLNFMRGEVAGLMLAVKLANLIAEGADATLELFDEARKLHEAEISASAPAGMGSR